MPKIEICINRLKEIPKNIIAVYIIKQEGSQVRLDTRQPLPLPNKNSVAKHIYYSSPQQGHSMQAIVTYQWHYGNAMQQRFPPVFIININNNNYN